MTKDEIYGIGKRFKNSKGYEFEIIEKLSHNGHRGYRRIKFDSGYETIVTPHRIKTGTIKDKNSPNTCGVGVMDIEGGKNDPLYTRWLSMLQRCYSKKNKAYQYYGAKGIYVCDDWLIFSNFVRDVRQKENYNKMISEKRKWHLDKDFLSKDEKCYSNETTCIVKSSDNNKERNLRAGHPSVKQRIGIIQMNLNGEVVNEFESMTRAAKVTGFSVGNICSCCKGKIRTSNGYIWRYK